MKCNSSRKGTNVSCLRSSRRKMLLSFSTTPRAESGSKRISDDTVFSVLNKKCGLIWLESASMRAFSSNCWCRSRFISIRVLFQIFSGAATDISVARTQSASHQSHCGSIANSHFGLVATASATRPSSRPTHASSGSNSHDTLRSRTKRTTARGIFKKGERAKIPEIFFVRDRLAHQAAKQSGRGRRGHRQPFVRCQGRDGDDRAANRPHHAAAEQAHQECAFERKIRKAIRKPHQAQRDADNQRRRHEQHQLQLLVGIAFLGEEHASKRVPAREQRRERRRHAHFQQQRKQQVLDGGQRVHDRCAQAAFANASQSPRRSKAPRNKAPRNNVLSRCKASHAAPCDRFRGRKGQTRADSIRTRRFLPPNSTCYTARLPWPRNPMPAAARNQRPHACALLLVPNCPRATGASPFTASRSAVHKRRPSL